MANTGLLRSDGIELLIGDKIFCDQHRATIRFIGEVPPTNGIWLGVEWDNPTRGKHNGCHEGKQYFQTSHPKSGSFIRPNKAEGGITAIQAVKDRYGLKQNAGVDSEELFVLDQYLQQTQVEMVGARKINLLQSQFSKLKSITMFDMQVYSAGPDGELGCMCPIVTHLDVSRNLLPSWESVATMAGQLSGLKDLNVSDNKLALPKNPSSLTSCFKKLTNITMNKMGMSWKEILTCCAMFPVLEEIHAGFNSLTQLADSSHVFQCLKRLDVMTNLISDWTEVLKLGNLPRLEILVISENKIHSVFFPNCSPTEKTPLFRSLKALIIKRNNISNWDSINELNKLNQLEELQLAENPIINTFKYETVRQLLIAKVGALKLIGRTPITFEERKGAEIDYLKRYGKDWKNVGGHSDPAKNRPSALFIEQHPRFQIMCDKWGPPEDSELEEKSSALKESLLTVKIESSEHPGKGVLQKKLPATMSIEKLKTLIQRMFKMNTEPKLAYSSGKKFDGPHIPLDHDMRQLGYFSIENADTIHVTW
ncbi:tubulin-specific chaperone e-like [Plakobranchus ocellatus]|uniref:Tubulin-specific chaperone E n=1 Tax=Plakobranchus ocellatus TaxID=259542 RepID=A0AAV3YJD5_9GAST|nr:tubulin-specific chaperone e-like [Plakobranchus ocellatus]